MELHEFIKEQLGIQDDKPGEALEILADKKEELKNAIEQIDLLRTQIRKKDFPMIWEKQIKNDFPEYEITGNWREPQDDLTNVGLKLSIEGRTVSVLIEFDEDEHSYYYGIVDNEKKYSKIQKKLSRLYGEMESNDMWYVYSSYCNEKEVYSQFKTFVEELIEKTQ
jgi:hypothetical protein